MERDLYPEYDASNPDHDPQRTAETPRSGKTQRFPRAPSPHPLKGSVTSRLARISRETMDRRRSESLVTDKSSPSKTILEALADAIRAPTSLFYKENKQTTKLEDEEALTQNPPSTGKTSPKKSVRFRSGNTVMDTEAKSSPIDIPTMTPSLPPVQLAQTPILQAFKRLQDPIPTARPQPGHVLRCSADFRQALAATKASDILGGLDDKALTEFPTPQPTRPGSITAADNPFDDPPEEIDPEISLLLLRGYDDGFRRRKSSSCPSSPEVAIEKGFPSNEDETPKAPLPTLLTSPGHSAEEGNQGEPFPHLEEVSTIELEETDGSTDSHLDQHKDRERQSACEKTDPRLCPDKNGQALWGVDEHEMESEKSSPPAFFSDSSPLFKPGEAEMVSPSRVEQGSPTLAQRNKLLDPRTVSASSSSLSLTSMALNKFRPTPSPELITLPSSARPSGRNCQLKYTDQYGWCPFDDYQFAYAAKAALELSQTAFVEKTFQEGGLWEFWNQAKLPCDTAPTRDTKGLCSWEIDDLLNSIRQEPTLPEPVTCMIVEDFKSVLARYFGSHDFAARPEQAQEKFDTSSVVQGVPFSRDDKSFGLFPPPGDQCNDPAGGDMNDALDCILNDATNLGHGDLSCSAVVEEEERCEKEPRVLENLERRRIRAVEEENDSTFVKRLGTMSLECGVAGSALRFGNDKENCLRISEEDEYDTETELAPELVDELVLFRRHPVRTLTTDSKWSIRSKRNRDESRETAETTSTISREPTDEDEQYCQGIV
ncbi:hypothetical protein LTS03_005942 [Exophiala xenobiotica]|nr:hypothetical protein LTR61_009520 [Exophiala xenobiotica]KAK5368854.1 hypothetical protein LTS13_007589 [Exophiala xenobiotica]KAK5375387.1 hypothetical protein LTS03_005942 [Exophiala xenobiotica]KAK5395604.1 hypothetical protein LTR79_007319 [Exophiala xenobiotica]KAK5472794.1 hypothetical protein LTR20_000253 [Exophiala xenobiotica]